MRGFAGPAVRVVALLWALAALALALSQAIRANPNSVLALIAAGLLAGAGLVWLLTLVIQRVDGAEVGGWGYEREMLVLALLVLSLAVPWRIEVRVAHAGAIVGWSTAVPWLTALGLVPTLSRRVSRFEPAGLALAGAALAAWLGWIIWLGFSPGFRSLGFPFRPVDLLDYGWYLALTAWVVAADGAAARAARASEGRTSAPELLAWSLSPGAGLVRLDHRVEGRLWLLGAAVVAFFVRGTGYTAAEFAFSASNAGQLPRPSPRNDFTVFAALLVAVWAAAVAAAFRVRRRDSAAQESG